MQADEEGFLYPVLQEENCTQCGACVKVCPLLEEQQERYPLVLYAAKSSDEKERKLSSSGGLFPQLAQQTVATGGVVFGAVFNSEWKVVQRWIDNSDALPLLQGSQYVQSEIGDTFREAKQFPSCGLDLLFSVSSCLLAGL